MKTRRMGGWPAKEFGKWVMDNGLTYSSIASVCGVSERTVRQWASQKDVPEKFSHCLKSLVESSRQTVTFIEGNREDGFKFKVSGQSGETCQESPEVRLFP